MSTADGGARNPAESEQGVGEVESRAREAVKQAAESARKATSYLSFWTFMSLLFGAVAATLGALLGGELRDQVIGRQAPLAAA